VRSDFTRLEDCPKQDFKGGSDAWLEIDPAFTEGLEGISTGDQLVLITWLHKANRKILKVHPRNNRNNPLRGVFTTRSPARPNPIGLHKVEIVKFETKTRLMVRPLAVLNGTPILDLKAVL
jgi:tRNA-Thr(GGU) m(6)t(6)A37 methyltransferase TsaA